MFSNVATFEDDGAVLLPAYRALFSSFFLIFFLQPTRALVSQLRTPNPFELLNKSEMWVAIQRPEPGYINATKGHNHW